MDGRRSIEDIIVAIAGVEPSLNGLIRETVLTFLDSINRGGVLAFND